MSGQAARGGRERKLVRWVAPPWLAPRPLAGAALVMAVLVAITTLYLQPDFVITLANQVWMCF